MTNILGFGLDFARNRTRRYNLSGFRDAANEEIKGKNNVEVILKNMLDEFVDPWFAFPLETLKFILYTVVFNHFHLATTFMDLHVAIMFSFMAIVAMMVTVSLLEREHTLRYYNEKLTKIYAVCKILFFEAFSLISKKTNFLQTKIHIFLNLNILYLKTLR